MPPFELDVHPVTVAEWMQFIASGGYDRSRLWSEAGWEWRETHRVTHPEYWIRSESGYTYCSVDRVRSLDPDEPVSAIGWYEADAYARWVGKRLPTETEWEFAAAFDPNIDRARRYPWGDDPGGAARVAQAAEREHRSQTNLLETLLFAHCVKNGVEEDAGETHSRVKQGKKK